MYEGGCDQDAGAEVSRKEQEVVRHREAWESADDDGEGARCGSLAHVEPGARIRVGGALHAPSANLIVMLSFLPPVLSARINISAKTCSGVLYSPLVLLPHAGLCSPAVDSFMPPCLRSSSAWSSAVGMSVHESGNMPAGLTSSARTAWRAGEVAASLGH